MEDKNSEIWIGKSRIYLGEDNIVYITVVGEVNEEIAVAARNAHFKLTEIIEGKINLLIDLNEARKQSHGARRIFKDLHEHEKTGKVAHFGLNPVARVIASFTIGSAKKKDVRFFKTKEEALAWLKE